MIPSLPAVILLPSSPNSSSKGAIVLEMQTLSEVIARRRSPGMTLRIERHCRETMEFEDVTGVCNSNALHCSFIAAIEFLQIAN